MALALGPGERSVRAFDLATYSAYECHMSLDYMSERRSLLPDLPVFLSKIELGCERFTDLD